MPDKLLMPTFPPSPYIACTPHTHLSIPLLSLGWRIGPIQKVSALGSRVGWTPAHKERTNEISALSSFQYCDTVSWAMGRESRL